MTFVIWREMKYLESNASFNVVFLECHYRFIGGFYLNIYIGIGLNVAPDLPFCR